MMERLKRVLDPPHPTFRSSGSRDLPLSFIDNLLLERPNAMIVNIGSADVRLHHQVVNFDLFLENEVDVQGDVLTLPFSDASIDAVVCTGVLEHVSDAYLATKEIYRVLKPKGKAYFELPWMQGIHASPNDFQRWTPEGYRKLFADFDMKEVRVVTGPASAVAWMLQEMLSMLFSFRNETLYKVGLRLFGWMVLPISWLDIVLEQHPRAASIASGFAILLVKK